jgi:hypothetical protein
MEPKGYIHNKFYLEPDEFTSHPPTLFNIHFNIILPIPKSLENVRCEVKTQNGISAPFITRKGLRQRDALLCMLFNTALEKAVRVTRLDIRGTILHKSVQILAYADDIVITGRAMKEAFV